MIKQNTAKAAQPAADLRQRAARARDAAGRFIKRSAPVEAETSPVEPDPALGLIEEHRAAYAEWDRLHAVWGEMGVDEPGYLEAVVASEEPARREIAAYDALFTAQPMSLAATAALGTYFGEAIRKTSTHTKPTDAERALAAITAAVQRLGASTVSPHPDAALFDLGAQFMAAWVAEEADEARIDEGESRTCLRITRQIVRTPAVTAAGYGIKALLLARLDSDATGPHKPIESHGPVDSWWNVLRQVQQGAARLVGSAVERTPVTAGPNEGRLPAPDHDLPALSIVELARLYTAMHRAEEVMGSAENAPCFWSEDRTTRTPAGQIVNREADRLSQFASAIAGEMGRRQPADDDEAEERANTLLSHMVLTGGVAEHPELIAEINATWGA